MLNIKNEELKNTIKAALINFAANCYGEDEEDASYNLEALATELAEALCEKSDLNNKGAVSHPSHYCDGGIETIDFIRAKLTKDEFVGYCKGNVLKYTSRAGKKGDPAEDMAKANVYAGWAEEALKEEV